MRVEVPLSAEDSRAFKSLVSSRFLNRTAVIRLCISIGLKVLYHHPEAGLDTSDSSSDEGESVRFNTATVDPYRIFEIVSYGIICRKRGWDPGRKTVIIAEKKDLQNVITRAFRIGLKEASSGSFKSLIPDDDLYMEGN